MTTEAVLGWSAAILINIVACWFYRRQRRRIEESNERNMASNRDTIAQIRKNTEAIEEFIRYQKAVRATGGFVSRGGDA